MTTREWLWEPDDFAAHWYSDGIDRFPRPLRYLSRYRTRDDLAAHRHRVRATLDPDQRELVDLAVHTLVHAEFRIEIRGGRSVARHEHPNEYRIVGARRGPYGVTLAQATIDEVDTPIRARLFPAAQLAHRLAAHVPRCTPGTEPPLTLDLADHTTPTSYARRTPRERFDALIRRPITGGGRASLLPGHILTRPTPWYTTQWIDVAADGRYHRHPTPHHLAIRPAPDLPTHFSRWTERALLRLHEGEPAS